MAFSRKNRAVVETNHVSAVRTGNIKAQYPAAAEMENGMALIVDDVAKSIDLANAAAIDDVIYLHASEEQVYEEHLGRNSFFIAEGKYPRALKLEAGDIFETNALNADGTYDAGVKLNVNAGEWVPVTTGAALATVVEMITLPNGEAGAKIVFGPETLA